MKWPPVSGKHRARPCGGWILCVHQSSQSCPRMKGVGQCGSVGTQPRNAQTEEQTTNASEMFAASLIFVSEAPVIEEWNNDSLIKAQPFKVITKERTASSTGSQGAVPSEAAPQYQSLTFNFGFPHPKVDQFTQNPARIVFCTADF